MDTSADMDTKPMFDTSFGLDGSMTFAVPVAMSTAVAVAFFFDRRRDRRRRRRG